MAEVWELLEEGVKSEVKRKKPEASNEEIKKIVEEIRGKCVLSGEKDVAACTLNELKRIRGNEGEALPSLQQG